MIPTCPDCDRELIYKKQKRRSSAGDAKRSSSAHKDQRHSVAKKSTNIKRSTSGSTAAVAEPSRHQSTTNKPNDAEIWHESANLSTRIDPCKSSRIDALVPLSSKSNLDRRASTGNVPRQSDPPINTGYSRKVSDPIPSTLSGRFSVSKSRRPSVVSRKSDPDGVKPNFSSASYKRSSSAPVTGKTVESRIQSYRDSLDSPQSSDPDGMSCRNLIHAHSAFEKPINRQSIPECKSLSSGSHYAHGPNKSGKKQAECISPSFDSKYSSKNKSARNEFASPTPLVSDYEEPSSPANTLERMVNYVRQSSAPATVSSQSKSKSTSVRHTSFESRKSHKSTDPEGHVAPAVSRPKKPMTSDHHRRHTYSGRSPNDSSNTLNQDFVVSETNVAKDFTHSKSSLDFNVDKLRQSSNTTQGTVDFEYSKSSLGVVQENENLPIVDEIATADDVKSQGETLSVKNLQSPMNKTLSPSVKTSVCDDANTLKSESYPYIFVPNAQDANEVGSTCSSFTESYAGRSRMDSSLAPTSSNEHTSSQKSVIFACGMPLVLSSPPHLSGDYTGQVNASTRQPHGLGSFIQSNGKALEGIWQDGALVTSFAGVPSPETDVSMSQRKTPIIRNRSSFELRAEDMPAVPLPADKSYRFNLKGNASLIVEDVDENDLD